MLTLGFSPCPNDTFIFYALVHNKIDCGGLSLSPIIDDVETLNRMAIGGELDVTKVSCHAYFHIRDDYTFLRSGGAFGRGCGPLLVARDPRILEPPDKREHIRIGIPGELTTAFLLLKLYLNTLYARPPVIFVPMVFHAIMPAVQEGRVDAGLIIHEGRFTYSSYGLDAIVDLGEWWEGLTGLPIPLGGIVAHKSLGNDTINRVESAIRRSVEYTFAHKEEALPYIKEYAQELSDDVIDRHIGLYVNEYTVDIGDEGAKALEELLKRASALGI